MRSDYPAESDHVGALIRLHRASLGVSIADMIRIYGPGNDREPRFVEAAKHPSVKLIERYHTMLMAAWITAEGSVVLPVARREQWWANEWDQALWHRAMDANRALQWWWSIQSDAAPRGAWCRLCNQMIHTYDVGRGLRRPGRLKVMQHRYGHVTELMAERDSAGKRGM